MSIRTLLHILFLVNILVLPFPYMYYNDIHYTGNGIFGALFNGFEKEYIYGLTLYSYETLLAYFPLVVLLFPYIKFLSKSQRAFKYIIVSSSGFLIWNIILYVALTAEPSFYNGYDDVVPAYGFWTQFLSTLGLLVISIKYRSSDPLSNRNSRNNELLDDSI